MVREHMTATTSKRWSGTTKPAWQGRSLLVPVMLFFVALNVIPTLWTIGLGFYDYTLGRGKPRFLGMENFRDIFSNRELWGAFSRTLIFMVVAVTIEVGLGIGLGFLFWRSAKMPGRRVALTMLFTPMVMAPIASGLFWKLIYQPTFGIANDLIVRLGGSRIDFLTNVNWAFPAVTFVDVWMWTPFMILMTLAALGSVPAAELEAAEVDRLSVRQRIRYVIWPNGKFILMLGILLRTIDAFKTTDLVLTMTTGGPGNKTEFVGLSLYRQAFNSFNLGYSSAVALVLLIIAIGFTSIYLYILNLSRAR
jgi:multiple sugar transport system permease protein